MKANVVYELNRVESCKQCFFLDRRIIQHQRLPKLTEPNQHLAEQSLTMLLYLTILLMRGLKTESSTFLLS